MPKKLQPLSMNIVCTLSALVLQDSNIHGMASAGSFTSTSRAYPEVQPAGGQSHSPE